MSCHSVQPSYCCRQQMVMAVRHNLWKTSDIGKLEWGEAVGGMGRGRNEMDSWLGKGVPRQGMKLYSGSSSADILSPFSGSIHLTGSTLLAMELMLPEEDLQDCPPTGCCTLSGGALHQWGEPFDWIGLFNWFHWTSKAIFRLHKLIVCHSNSRHFNHPAPLLYGA